MLRTEGPHLARKEQPVLCDAIGCNISEEYPTGEWASSDRFQFKVRTDDWNAQEAESRNDYTSDPWSTFGGQYLRIVTGLLEIVLKYICRYQYMDWLIYRTYLFG